MDQVLILNGPNLNLLGAREPAQYGRQTLAEIIAAAVKVGEELGAEVDHLQSNAEHELIERVHAAGGDGTGCIVLNPGALTHTSIALRDALLGVGVPFIELHLSNVHAREDFRRRSYFSDVAAGLIVGLGARGYPLAVRAAVDVIRETQS